MATEGAIKLNFKEISVNDIVDHSVKPLKNQIRDKEINLILNIEAGLPKLNVDAEKVAWVIVNLISNSIRYTPRWGKISIDVTKDNGLIKFIVIDNGVGVAEKDIEKIFEPLISLGMGLALPLSRDIIEAHGGSIHAESVAGNGSSFIFTIPV